MIQYFTYIKTEEVKINNTKLRIDVGGNQMDIHDGNIIMHPEYSRKYYFYGMGYANCQLEHSWLPPQECPGIYRPFGRCGFRADHSIRLYTSTDLVAWNLESENILPLDSRPYGIYFRPKVIYNTETKKYVLWVNHLPDNWIPLLAYRKARLLVATSDFPNGPFNVINENANLKYKGAGDFTLMVDPKTSKAYVAYGAWSNSHSISIEELNRDYTDSTGVTTPIISPKDNEAPILFERKGYYYLLFGHICCFCKEGSGIEVWIAKHPLGPWTSMNTEINPITKSTRKRVIQAQANYVFQVVNNQTGNITYVYTGDRWGSASDNLKSHDLQYWYPLTFDDGKNPAEILPMSFLDEFTLDL